MNQNYLLVEEIADELRVSNMTVYRYIKSGSLPAYKLGKEYRIKSDDFISFMKDARTVGQLKFIDLFAGLGGTRIGFEQACVDLGIEAKCVFTSEIKPHAVDAYSTNFIGEKISGDITKIDYTTLPDFDYLLGGFPCQPFSSAGKRLGFFDTRGTLFFNIEEILRVKKPVGFLLENVEGLANHNQGKTLQVIISNLSALGYHTSWRVLDAKNHGVPQSRRRTYIVGRRDSSVNINQANFKKRCPRMKDILEDGLEVMNTDFTKKLLHHYSVSDVIGKSIKDKRGGPSNIHSWDIHLKGRVSNVQKKILNKLLRERRKKHWAEKKGIKWMDGMPLTLNEILTFIDCKKDLLQLHLDDLVVKGYLRLEYPKKVVEQKNGIQKREYDTEKERGYNIVAGKLSFEISKILHPEGIAPTLVATDSTKLAVPDGCGVRRLTVREGLRLFGFPEDYKLEVSYSKAFDLLGNTVVVPVIKDVASVLLNSGR